MFGVKQELFRFFNFDDEEEGALEFIQITRETIADKRADFYYIFQSLLLLTVSWVKFMLFYKGTYYMTIGGLFALIFNGGLILDCSENMVFSTRFLALFTIAILNDCQFVGHRDWSKAW